MIGLDLLSHRVVPSGSEGGTVQPESSGSPEKPERLDAVEADLIRQTLERTRWNRSAAARRLGVSRTGLAKKIKRLGLES